MKTQPSGLDVRNGNYSDEKSSLIAQLKGAGIITSDEPTSEELERAHGVQKSKKRRNQLSRLWQLQEQLIPGLHKEIVERDHGSSMMFREGTMAQATS